MVFPMKRISTKRMARKAISTKTLARLYDRPVWWVNSSFDHHAEFAFCNLHFHLRLEAANLRLHPIN